MISNNRLSSELRKQQNDEDVSSINSGINNRNLINNNNNDSPRTSYVQMSEPIQCRSCLLETRPQGPLTTNQIIDATVLHVLLGWTGALHFYLGRHGWGLLYLCTFGLLGVGYLYDFFRLPYLFAEYNKRQLHGPSPLPIKPYELGEAYVFWLSFGWIGGHHFYLGNIGRGLLYLCTCGGLGVLFIIDLFLMPKLVREANIRAQSTPEIIIQHRNNCRYCQGISSGPISATATRAYPQKDAIAIEEGIYSATGPSSNIGSTYQIGADDALIIKSTTVYTPRDQTYTTDAHATAITNQGATNIPYAYTVKSDNQQNP